MCINILQNIKTVGVSQTNHVPFMKMCIVKQKMLKYNVLLHVSTLFIKLVVYFLQDDH
jgi:hypothetical protein